MLVGLKSGASVIARGEREYMIDLRDRVALVTGALQGIGAATARALAAAGARVILADQDDPIDFATQIGGLARRLDVTSEADWVDAMAFAKEEAGGLDILVNNAGIFQMKPLVDTTQEEWRRVQAVNVEGMFLGCKHAIPLLNERAGRWSGGAAIINLSSIGGIIGSANAVNYCTSKGAVRIFTKALAMELAPQKIRVNSVHPGFTDTPLAEKAAVVFSELSGVSVEEGRAQLAHQHPLGRNAKPSEIADGVVFLASDRASFMTGSELIIDGGMTAH
jgi:NAD(P)-dependent dehydrogenase (short-subunit alcohol dehydrogenase family)